MQEVDGGSERCGFAAILVHLQDNILAVELPGILLLKQCPRFWDYIEISAKTGR